MTAQSFSLTVALLVGLTGWFACLIKAYTGFGGGIVYVSLLKLWDSSGVLGVEGGEDGLGGFVGCQGLVTVMEFFVSAPLVVKMWNECHWPLVIVITLGTLPMVPVGTIVLQMTMGNNTELVLELNRIFGVVLVIVVAMQLGVELYQKRKRAVTGLREDKSTVELQDVESEEKTGEVPLLLPMKWADTPVEYELRVVEIQTPKLSDGGQRPSREANAEAQQPEAVPDEQEVAVAIAEYSPNCVEILERRIGGQWRHWELLLVVSGALSGALAGILGAVFGAGGPAIILLFAYLNGRDDLGTSPAALRSTAITSYTLNLATRMVTLSVQDMFFFNRWLGYYAVVSVGGFIGALVGAYLATQYTTSVRGFQRILQAMLLFCGLFFLAAQP